MLPSTNNLRRNTPHSRSYSGAILRACSRYVRSKRGHYLKGLYRDRSGLCLFAKRLERGKFVWPPLVHGTSTSPTRCPCQP
jgi:transposase